MLTVFFCTQQRTCSWRAATRRTHDDIGEGWCVTFPHRMLRQTHAIMTQVCASKYKTCHFDTSRFLLFSRDSLRDTIRVVHAHIDEGWCFPCPPRMLFPTITAMVHLCASQPCFADVFCSAFLLQRTKVRGGMDDTGEGWCFTCPLRMLHPTNVTMILVRVDWLQSTYSRLSRFEVIWQSFTMCNSRWWP